MKLGIIARCDEGGLATQTCSMVRHLKPDLVVVMDLGPKGRGKSNLDRISAEHDHEMIVCVGTTMDTKSAVWLLKRSDVVLSAETFYRDDFDELAIAADVVTILQANPELHRAERTASMIVNPTPYMTDRLPRVLPFPVPTPEELHATPRQRTGPAKVFLHIAAPATRDRNGTQIVMEAIPHITAPDVTIRILGAPPTSVPRGRGPKVNVEWIAIDEWWEAYSNDVDVLLAPRRYAGLCLPMQEAAALGIPTVTLDCAPWSNGYGDTIKIPTRGKNTRAFAGGMVDIWDAYPLDLAMTIDRLATEPDMLTKHSGRTLDWAAANSWAELLPRYERILRMAT